MPVVLFEYGGQCENKFSHANVVCVANIVPVAQRLQVLERRDDYEANDEDAFGTVGCSMYSGDFSK